MTSAISNNINTPTVWGVAKDYIQTPLGIQRMVLAPAIRLFAWAEYFGVTLSKTAKVAQKTFKNTNHFFFWLQYPERVTNFSHALVDLKHACKKGALLEVGDQSIRAYMHGVFAIDIFADLSKILHNEKLITLSGKVLHIVNYIGFLGSTAIVIAGVRGTYERIQDLRKYDYNTPEYNLNFIRLINRISLLALGVFGVISFTAIAAVPTLATLIASTILLITALSAHFYEKIVVAKSGS